MPLPPHAPEDATPGARSHPVIEAALSAARGPYSPVTHKAPVRSPSRRAWIAVGLLVALTALPTLVVLLAGRAALRYDDPPDGYRADGGQPVVVAPGPYAAPPRPPAAVAPEGGAPGAAAPAGVDGLAGGAVATGNRPESSPCPPSSAAAGSGGAQAAGGGGAPAGGVPPGSSSSGDGVSVPPATGNDQNEWPDEPSDGATGDDGGSDDGGSDGSDDGSGGQVAAPAPGRPGSGSGGSGSGSGSGSGGGHGSGGSTGSGFIENVLEGLGIKVG